MAESFKDLFSAQAADYQRYRPHYPDGLFKYLATLSKERSAVWDAGCGNGQAAVALAPYFSKVFATDPSANQLDQAITHPKVAYSQATAESSGLPEYSVNLVVVAQAFHWFKQEEFYREVRRVCEPGGALAIWCYELSSVDQEVDPVVMRLYQEILGAFWDPERRMVEEGYRHEKLPFNELQPPPFDLTADWDFHEFMGYLGTWSALQKYKKQHGKDPREIVESELREAWGDPHEKKEISWPLSLRVFQVA
ncbi:MAG: class I SAM-dependent methyltransferase [Proteobacteria bacterium]|nr:MAG: class I SAM-dependent methyltransferase [Pseudomonadota bacterium]